MERMAKTICTALVVLAAAVAFASRVPGTPQLPTERKVYEIYNDRYDTAYESAAELDAMRVHDMDFFDLPENHYVYVQGIAHCANEKPGTAPRERHRRDTGLSPRLFILIVFG